MRKILLCIISILIIMCVTLLSYEKINKTEIGNDTGMFAIFLEEEKDSGKYQKSNLKTWPTEEEYTINMLKSYCENGSILRWNNVDKKISLKVNGTDKCYVYFDKAEIGTEKHPHLIQTIEDLVRLSNDVNNGTTYAGEYFLLTNDLDFNDPSDYENPESMEFGNINGINGDEALIKELTTGSGFIPIGKDDSNSFQGNFNGNNHTLSNLYIDNNDKDYVGLFGVIYGNTINNLNITGVIKNNIISNIGGLIGKVNGKVNIFNINSNINITNDTMGCIIGGIIGLSNSELEIKNSVNNGKIKSVQNVFIGGLLGKDFSSYIITTISDSYNNGEIIIEEIFENEETIINNVGGIIGSVDGILNINNCHNSANLKSVGLSYIGGLVGLIQNANIVFKSSSIINSYNEGNICGSNVGGLVSMVVYDENIIIDSSYNLGKLSAHKSSNSVEIGGLVAHNSGGSKVLLINCFNAGDIELLLEHGQWSYTGGIISVTNWSGKSYVINTYNEGNINSTTVASGIGHAQNNAEDGTSLMVINNFYNIGNIKGVPSYGVVSLFSLDYKVTNAYNNDTVLASGVSNSINVTDDFIRSQDFVNALNSNIVNENALKDTQTNETTTLEEIEPSLKGYHLSKWQLGDNGYPTLINE